MSNKKEVPLERVEKSSRSSKSTTQQFSKKALTVMKRTMALQKSIDDMNESYVACAENDDPNFDDFGLMFETFLGLHELIKSQSTRCHLMSSRVSFTDVPNLLESMGITESKLSTTGQKWKLVDDISVKQPDASDLEGKKQLVDWLHNQGQEEIITESINASTLKSRIKTLMKQASDDQTEFNPPSCLEINPTSSASLTKK